MTATGLLPRVSTKDGGGWDLSRARSLQAEIEKAVVEQDRLGDVRTVAGADVAYDRRERTLYATVVVLDLRSLHTLETATFAGPATFPYVPGYLSFREAPSILEAWSRLGRSPDLLMVDGHGRAHPRRAGLACHLGVVLDVPAIGVAKSLLVGDARQPGRHRGSIAPLIDSGERVGTLVRTRDGVAPVYVSVGHRVSLESAVRWTLACGAGYRLPEPTRRAHLTVTALRSGRSTPA